MLDSGLTDVVYSNHEAVKPNRTPSQAEPETPDGSRREAAEREKQCQTKREQEQPTIK